jgi:hypothetical protein
MRAAIGDLFARALVGAIVFAGIVVVAFALTGRWPPQALFVGASIGGALSPAFWSLVRRASDRPSPSADTDEGPHGERQKSEG